MSTGMKVMMATRANLDEEDDALHAVDSSIQNLED